MTQEEADAALMREHGLSRADVWSLGFYWRKLLLGYRVPEQQRASLTPEQVDARMKAQIARLRPGGPGMGGWRRG